MPEVIALTAHRDGDGNRHAAGEVYDCASDRLHEHLRQSHVATLASMPRILWANMRGRSLSPFSWPSRYLPHAGAETRPRVLQMTRYDPGSAVYRYYSAANTVERGISALVRYGHDNPYCDLRQYDGDTDRGNVRGLFDSADVVHVHMDFDTLDNGVHAWPDRRRQMLVRHYHGSQPRMTTDVPFVQNARDAELGAVQIGARLYHNRFSERMQWLPIPVPVDDYAALVGKFWKPIEQRANPLVRVCHSPTHTRIKGTIELETVIEILRRKGLPVELVMIQGQKHERALEIKASCDITFDSFWLGIQGSGLEAACMGQMVLAGDREVRAEYCAYAPVGECPYTFVGDVEELAVTLERAVADAAWRASEAARVAAYTRKFHDYPAVGARYWSIIEHAMQERGYATT